MPNRIHDSATSNVLAWSSLGAHMQHEPDDEATTEADEPPDDRRINFTKNQIQRSTGRKPVDSSQSLLTKALQQQVEDGAVPLSMSTFSSRRRSLNSNVSVASTAELTSDTGLTSPARTDTPSPPPPAFQLRRLNTEPFGSKPKLAANALGIMNVDTTLSQNTASVPAEPKSTDTAVEVPAKKRCISFACGPKPEAKKPMPSQAPAVAAQTNPAPASTEKPPKRTIKFACNAKPSAPDAPAASNTTSGPSSSQRKHRSPSASRGRGRTQRSLTPRRSAQSPVSTRPKKFLAPNATDLNRESSRFHEFASDELREADWIRQNFPLSSCRLTINDTLRKENEIRRLGKEAEEEALEEEEEQEKQELGDDDDEVEEEDDEDSENDEDSDNEDSETDEVDDEADEAAELDDNFSGYNSDDDSDGYHTDNEVGFADSDDDGEGGELDLWTHGQAEALQASGATPIARRRPSLSGNRSDSSSTSGESETRGRTFRSKTRRIKIRPGTPELPDSTDFVCGTLDEDRPLEDAYISCITQKRLEKLHLIPQDIDPSFPTSDPEDDEEEQGSLKSAHGSEDHVWIHGEIEDLHHDQNRTDRPTKRYQSPPPKRHVSPAPKARGRSPRKVPGGGSPRRLVSPPPPSGRKFKSPIPSPARDGMKRRVEFQTLAPRPALTQTKSLPRSSCMFPNHLKGQRRRQAAHMGTRGHVRGAIDIVKGLEHKRERRREKFLSKHCSRARKGQLPEKKTKPGLGAERMRELGLLMAGKLGPAGNYVLSI